MEKKADRSRQCSQTDQRLSSTGGLDLIGSENLPKLSSNQLSIGTLPGSGVFFAVNP